MEKELITSKDCYLKGICKKFKKTNCECRDNDVYCVKLFKIDYLYDNALLTTKQKQRVNFRLNDDEPDAQVFSNLRDIESDIVNFVKNGNNLYIHSMICGNGKTAWATRLLQDYINATWIEAKAECNALFINVPRFLLALKDSISNQSDYIDHIKNNVLNADLVVWDEVATKALTVYEHEHLLSLINTRLDEGKSNIYTSNLAPSELIEKLGDRLYSRIYNYSTVMEFTSVDKRGLIK